MKKIAFLRGINVGGKRKLAMNDLLQLCRDIGWQNPSSYIQSGNLMFESKQDNHLLEAALEQQIAHVFSYEVPVIVRNKSDITSIIQNNPFVQQEIAIEQLHLTLLKNKPDQEKLSSLVPPVNCEDHLTIGINCLYIHCKGKYHKSKLTNPFFEKKLGVKTTTRNWRTILKLMERCG